MKNTFTLLIISLSLFITNEIGAQCLENTHSPFEDHAWLSCETSIGPIAQRGDRHWLMYDLGHDYVLDSVSIWNYNVWGETGNAVKEILIDYSMDQINWNTIGPFDVDAAPGSWKYNQTTNLFLGNIPARYVLISVLETWDDNASCAGIGELKFTLGMPTNLEEIVELTEIQLSPNPTHDLLNLEWPLELTVDNIQIYNNLGGLVRSFDDLPGNRFSTPVNDMLAGVYHVRISAGTSYTTKSFVKASF